MSAPDVAAVARRLVASADALTALVEDVDGDESRWKLTPEKWSINDIFGHLIDEERHDFRQRVQILLEDPTRPWPPIDPEGWVREKNFNARALSDLTGEFLAERQRSVAWLVTQGSANWDQACTHPTAGVLSAWGLLHNWAAHDLLHVRQIVAVRYARLAVKTAPATLDYAGRW
ncbi:MAG: DinB family protein [Candidatus Krumholzibacteria bacterium]|nr:DinB family protein [Candidatus Krumholzibacteria bacterium]MDH4335835.1 DinB family protein [Candidatus Krumholzibacteria bacterium]MDH5269361.1 DinB family protein [Candidatus Krumholzibacteria bacterium]